MKKQILISLEKIKNTALETGMQGNISIEFYGCTIQEWDEIIESITEYPRYKHSVDVTPKLTVNLLFG